MPIEAPTLAKAVERFKDHLNRVLALTVTQSRLVQVRAKDSPHFSIGFRGEQGKPIAALMNTRFGPMELSLGQLCEGIPLGEGKFRLLTGGYRYALTEASSDEPWIRWEYRRAQPEHQRWCRHHLQGDIALPIRGRVNLNDLHLPTGYVTIEEVIRFCITDLLVKPLSQEWHEVLQDSYRKFKEEFAA